MLHICERDLVVCIFKEWYELENKVKSPPFFNISQKRFQYICFCKNRILWEIQLQEKKIPTVWMLKHTKIIFQKVGATYTSHGFTPLRTHCAKRNNQKMQMSTLLQLYFRAAENEELQKSTKGCFIFYFSRHRLDSFDAHKFMMHFNFSC